MAAFERAARYVQGYVQGGRVLIKHQAVDISRFKIVKAMFPQTAGAYAGPEQ